MSRRDKRELASLLDASRTHDTDEESAGSDEPSETDPLIAPHQRNTIN